MVVDVVSAEDGYHTRRVIERGATWNPEIDGDQCS